MILICGQDDGSGILLKSVGTIPPPPCLRVSAHAPRGTGARGVAQSGQPGYVHPGPSGQEAGVKNDPPVAQLEYPGGDPFPNRSCVSGPDNKCPGHPVGPSHDGDLCNKPYGASGRTSTPSMPPVGEIFGQRAFPRTRRRLAVALPRPRCDVWGAAHLVSLHFGRRWEIS